MNEEDIRQVMKWLGFAPTFHDGTKARPGEYRRSGYYLATRGGLVWRPYVFETPEAAWEHLPANEMQLMYYALRQIPQSPRLDICQLPDPLYFIVWRVAPDLPNSTAVTHQHLVYALAKVLWMVKQPV